jgi:hypothetical protein
MGRVSAAVSIESGVEGQNLGVDRRRGHQGAGRGTCTYKRVMRTVKCCGYRLGTDKPACLTA